MSLVNSRRQMHQPTTQGQWVSTMNKGTKREMSLKEGKMRMKSIILMKIVKNFVPCKGIKGIRLISTKKAKLKRKIKLKGTVETFCKLRKRKIYPNRRSFSIQSVSRKNLTKLKENRGKKRTFMTKPLPFWIKIRNTLIPTTMKKNVHRMSSLKNKNKWRKVLITWAKTTSGVVRT